MSHTLLAVLGGMLVDKRFRRALMKKEKKSAKATKAARGAALRARGFFLTRGEGEILARMVKSFESGRLDRPCRELQDICPEWPCSFFKFD